MTPAQKKIPSAILEQHIAVLGKTGSGKTSTAKLAIEQVVAEGARVCVLDPIKSDWWGLTSSADGRHAGLPFHILGGPHGHVPLHASAGKAVAEIVASGALPLSIVDMADFEPGGQARFFTDFAPALLRKMRGVVYLVIEEAHLFAPKERSGIGAENLSIHWAKTMATAGRSKGIRLMLVTQRTQALHNALLGSCDTLIAHRLTAPADQEPVVKWLKANTTKEVLDEVSSSLASLKTGDGWICSGEAKLFERVHFARIATYDNTATPTGDATAREVKTAPVDQEKLRAIIGDAVEQARQDDPRELRKQLAEKDRLLKQLQTEPTKPAKNITKSIPALSDADRALLEKVATRIAEAVSLHHEDLVLVGQRFKSALDLVAGEHGAKVIETTERAQRHLQALFEAVSVQKVLAKLATVSPIHPTTTNAAGPRSPQASRVAPALAPATSRRPARLVSEAADRRVDVVFTRGEDVGLGGAERRVLNALAELQALGVAQPERIQVAFFAGYTNLNTKGFANAIGALRSAGYIEYPTSGRIVLTASGEAAADVVEAPRSPAEVRDRIVQMLGGASARLLDPLIKAYPNAMSREDLAAASNYGNLNSKGFANAIGRLRSLGFIDYPTRGEVAAQPVLFLEG